MNDTYLEILIEKKTESAKIKSLAAMVLAILLLLSSLFWNFLLAILLTVILGSMSYYFYVQAHTEYEYMYFDKELSIDRILMQSRRKRIETFLVERMEIFAPVDSVHLEQFQGKKVKVTDYSSADKETAKNRYVFYYEGGRKIILEKDEKLGKAFRMVAPSKVFLD